MRIKIKNKNIGIVFVYVYIFSIYIKPLNFGASWNQISLYTLLIAGALTILFNIRRFKLLDYYIWYAVFIIISFASCSYALEPNVAFGSLYSLLVVFGLTVSVTVLVNNKKDIENILICFAGSGFILFMILLCTNQLIVNERLGQSLFGNTNTFAAMIMFSLFCSIWLLVKNAGYQKSIYLIFVVAQFYMLFLSGGRKYVLIPLFFLYILLMLNVEKRKKIKIVQYTVTFGAILIIVYWAIFNVPQLYNTIGFRMESLINLFTGHGLDSYDMGRQEMIYYGLNFWAQKPLFGYGINNYQILYAGISGRYVYSHNNYIEILVNVGMIGFVAYYAYYIYLLRKLWNKKGNSLNLRNFFIAYVICLLPFELGAITYNFTFIQLFLALASCFLFIERKNISLIKDIKGEEE